ncbi:hypothetical protein QL285_052929 [Trifolium repens]|nr:hypothetical protein QL285_052929 [Trifolium repens]
MVLELLFQANRFICKSLLDNKEVPTLSCYRAIKKNLGLIWGNYLGTSFNHGAHSLEKPFSTNKAPQDQIMSKGIKIKDLTNQFKTLLIKGRSPEDPVGPAKHVSRMGQSRGKPLREGEPISVSWPKVKEKRQNASNAQQTGARQYTRGQVLPIPSSYSSKV